MSNIDVYNAIKTENKHAIGRLNLALQRTEEGVPNLNNDKGCFRFYDSKVWDSDMRIFIHSCYGYYGSSSAYSIESPTIKKYVIDVLNKKSKEIVEEAIKNLEADIEKARLACVEEAKKILETV
jgi:hypothetical protein